MKVTWLQREEVRVQTLQRTLISKRRLSVLIALLLVPSARSQSNNPSGIFIPDTKSLSHAQEPKNGNSRIDRLRSAAHRDPQSAQIHNEVGLARGEIGDLTGAPPTVEASRHLAPSLVTALYSFGIT